MAFKKIAALQYNLKRRAHMVLIASEAFAEV